MRERWRSRERKMVSFKTGKIVQGRKGKEGKRKERKAKRDKKKGKERKGKKRKRKETQGRERNKRKKRKKEKTITSTFIDPTPTAVKKTLLPTLLLDIKPSRKTGK